MGRSWLDIENIYDCHFVEYVGIRMWKVSPLLIDEEKMVQRCGGGKRFPEICEGHGSKQIALLGEVPRKTSTAEVGEDEDSYHTWVDRKRRKV